MMNENEKKSFHKKYKGILKKIALEHLNLSPSSFDLRSNMGGPAVSGEITLHSNNIYIQISKFKEGQELLVRTCDGLKDFSGHKNRSFSLDFLDMPSDFAEYINGQTYDKFGVNANGLVPIKYIVNIYQDTYDSDGEKVASEQIGEDIYDTVEEAAEHLNNNSNALGSSDSLLTPGSRNHAWFMDTEASQDRDFFEKGLHKYPAYFVRATVRSCDDTPECEIDIHSKTRTLSESEFIELVEYLDGIEISEPKVNMEI